VPVYLSSVFSRELPAVKTKIILVLDLQSLRIKAYLCTRKKKKATGFWNKRQEERRVV